MTLHPDSIRPIYQMPGHPQYGPCRRLWVMLEQLYADHGGVAAVEVAIERHQTASGRIKVRWYDHLSWLMNQGQSEASAQRTVMMQVLVACEFVL